MILVRLHKFLLVSFSQAINCRTQHKYISNCFIFLFIIRFFNLWTFFLPYRQCAPAKRQRFDPASADSASSAVISVWQVYWNCWKTHFEHVCYSYIQICSHTIGIPIGIQFVIKFLVETLLLHKSINYKSRVRAVCRGNYYCNTHSNAH